MLSEYSFLKLQTLHGEEHFVHALPALIASKRAKDIDYPISAQETRPEVITITNVLDTFYYHCVTFYSQGQYFLMALTPISVNGKSLQPFEPLVEELKLCKKSVFSSLNAHLLKGSFPNELMAKHMVALKSISKILIESQQESEVYYLCLPSATQQRTLVAVQKSSSSKVIQPSIEK